MPRNYKKPRYLYFLSEHDEFVPENYLPLAQIFSDPRCTLPGYTAEEWCLGENALKKMRKETYEEVRIRFRISRAERFDKYWNANLASINSIGLNQFERLKGFHELGGIIVCFQNTMQTHSGKKKHVISFGIRRDLYRKWYDNIADAIQNETTPKKIYLKDAKIRNNGNMIVSTQKTYILFNGKDESGGRIVFEKNDLFNAFSDWCKLQGITKKQGIYQAMALIMSENPVYKMEDVKAYRRKTDIEMEEILADIEVEDCRTLSVKIDNSIINSMEAVVNRFNRDANNYGKKRLTKGILVKNAIMYYFKHLPLKYTDPKAYKEYLSTKEAEEYNNKIINR